MSRFSTFSAALLLATVLPATALAEPPAYNRVSLHAEASREVVRDRMHVMLYVEEQSSDPARLAAEITQTLNQAISQARQTSGVEISLGNRTSRPLYQKEGKLIDAWRERAELLLASQDFAALSRLTGSLLGSLKMGNLSFSVSDSLRKQHEDSLLRELIAAFQGKSRTVTEALGGHQYRLVSLNLNSSSPYPPVLLRSMAMKASAADAPPTMEIEAGRQTLTLSADGQIEVQLP